jgi:ABC-type branched-subunit amino acid transport system substrate-binding protein
MTEAISLPRIRKTIWQIMLAVSDNDPRSPRRRRNLLGFRQRPAFFVTLSLLLVACAWIPGTRPVVKIGLVGPFQGTFRYVGYDAIYAARLAVQTANRRGGVAGYSVRLVAYDDRGTIEGAQNAARNLALDPEVIAVIGHFLEETTAAARETYVRAGLSLIEASSVEPGIEEMKLLFCALVRYLGGQITDYSTDGFLDPKILLFTQDVEAVEQQTADCARGLLIEVSDAVSMPPSGFDVILFFDDAVQAGEIVAELRQTNWRGLIAGGPTLGGPLFSQQTDVSGVMFAALYRWPDSEAQDAAFAAAYQSLGPHVPRPGPFALTTFEDVNGVVDALATVRRQGQRLTRQSIKANLDTVGDKSEAVFIYRWATAEDLELLFHQEIRN